MHICNCGKSTVLFEMPRDLCFVFRTCISCMVLRVCCIRQHFGAYTVGHVRTTEASSLHKYLWVSHVIDRVVCGYNRARKQEIKL